MRKPAYRTHEQWQEAYADLHGRIGQWIAQYGAEHDYPRVVLYLSRIMAELRYAHDTAIAWRLKTLMGEGEACEGEEEEEG